MELLVIYMENDNCFLNFIWILFAKAKLRKIQIAETYSTLNYPFNNFLGIGWQSILNFQQQNFINWSLFVLVFVISVSTWKSLKTRILALVYFSKVLKFLLSNFWINHLASNVNKFIWSGTRTMATAGLGKRIVD